MRKVVLKRIRKLSIKDKRFVGTPEKRHSLTLQQLQKATFFTLLAISENRILFPVFENANGAFHNFPTGRKHPHLSRSANVSFTGLLGWVLVSAATKLV